MQKMKPINTGTGSSSEDSEFKQGAAPDATSALAEAEAALERVAEEERQKQEKKPTPKPPRSFCCRGW